MAADLLPCELSDLPNPAPPPSWLPAELHRPHRLPARPKTTTALHHRRLVNYMRVEAATAFVKSPWSEWEFGDSCTTDSFVTSMGSSIVGRPFSPVDRRRFSQPVSRTLRSEHVHASVKGNVAGGPAAFSSTAAFERERRRLVRELASTKGRVDAIRRRSQGAPLREGDVRPFNGRLDQSTPAVESLPPPPRSARARGCDEARAVSAIGGSRNGSRAPPGALQGGGSLTDRGYDRREDEQGREARGTTMVAVGELGLSATSGLRVIGTPDDSGIYPPPLPVPGSADYFNPPPTLSPRLWGKLPAHKGPMGAPPPPPPWLRPTTSGLEVPPPASHGALSSSTATTPTSPSRGATSGAWRAVVDAGGAWRGGRDSSQGVPPSLRVSGYHGLAQGDAAADDWRSRTPAPGARLAPTSAAASYSPRGASLSRRQSWALRRLHLGASTVEGLVSAAARPADGAAAEALCSFFLPDVTPPAPPPDGANGEEEATGAASAARGSAIKGQQQRRRTKQDVPSSASSSARGGAPAAASAGERRGGRRSNKAIVSSATLARIRTIAFAAAARDSHELTSPDSGKSRPVTLTWRVFVRTFFRRAARRQMTLSEMREIFELAAAEINGRLPDDGDAVITSSDEFLLWTHAVAQRMNAATLKALFLRYDTAAVSATSQSKAEKARASEHSGDGSLDAFEFYRLAEDLGFAELAHELFVEIDRDGSGSVTYLEVADPRYLTRRKPKPASFAMRKFLTALAFDGERCAVGRGLAGKPPGVDPAGFHFTKRSYEEGKHLEVVVAAAAAKGDGETSNGASFRVADGTPTTLSLSSSSDARWRVLISNPPEGDPVWQAKVHSAGATSSSGEGVHASGASAPSPPLTNSSPPLSPGSDGAPLLERSRTTNLRSQGDLDAIAEALRAYICAFLRAQGASAADLFELISGERAKRELAKGRGRHINWTIDAKEFTEGMLKLGVGISCKGPILDAVFAQIDCLALESDGRVSFGELYLWLYGLVGRAHRARDIALGGWDHPAEIIRLRELDWDAPALCRELNGLLSREGLDARDLFRGADIRENDGSLSKREYLQMIKRLIDDLALYDAEVRHVALDVFEELRSGTRYKKEQVDVDEFLEWMSSDGQIWSSMDGTDEDDEADDILANSSSAESL